MPAVKLAMDSPGFEPGASRVQGGRSTVELRARACGGFLSNSVKSKRSPNVKNVHGIENNQLTGLQDYFIGLSEIIIADNSRVCLFSSVSSLLKIQNRKLKGGEFEVEKLE